MLNGKLLHPEILRVLAQSGHGSKVLIADGNYPFNSGSPEKATKVFLNLMPGIPKVTDVLEALIDTVSIESAEVMMPIEGGEPAIFTAFQKYLPGIKLIKRERFEFYDIVRSKDTTLVIATAEQRVYANILLTIGVVASK